LIGKLNKNFIVFILLTGFLIQCSKKKEEATESSYEERVILAIDAREFEKAVNVIEKEMPVELSTTPKFQTLRANASLGMGGLDLIDVVNRARGPVQDFNQELNTMYGDCPRGALSADENIETRCWLVRLMKVLPKPENKRLQIAEDIYEEQIQRKIRISVNNQILMGVLKTSEVFKRFGDILQFYLSTGDEISPVQAQEIFDEILVITDLYKPWFDSIEVLPEQIHQKLTGSSEANLLSLHSDKLDFVENTGIPFLEAKLDESNQGLTAKLTRAFLVQEIDSMLRDFFKVQ